MNESLSMTKEELTMQAVIEVRPVATLAFGIGNVGADRHLEGEKKNNYLRALGKHQYEIPKGLWLPIDCMDERGTIKLADGTTDPTTLAARRAGQLPGGAVLATVKAAIAADAAFLKDAKNVTQAYKITYDLFKNFGIPDAAHEGCGASNFVHKSVAERLSKDAVVASFAALGMDAATVRQPVAKLDQNKKRRLEEGFYDGWDPQWHADFVSSRQPENFSYLNVKDDAVKGHHASGLLLVKDGHYFAKNQFIEDTGAQSFALTFGEADKIANRLGGSAEEKALMSLAFKDDAFNVANHIVAPGLEVNA